MTSPESPWEPPFAGTEVEHLLGALDRQRTTFRFKTDDLDAAGLRTRVGASTMTLGGLLKHLAFVEAHCSRIRMSGISPGAPWETVDWGADPDWEWTSAAGDSPEQLYALYDAAVVAARERYAAAIAAGGLDQAVSLTGPDEEPVSLRRILFDLLEEYGRHTGHADLFREAVDGRVGEDPTPGWRPRSA